MQTNIKVKNQRLRYNLQQAVRYNQRQSKVHIWEMEAARLAKEQAATGNMQPANNQMQAAQNLNISRRKAKNGLLRDLSGPFGLLVSGRYGLTELLGYLSDPKTKAKRKLDKHPFQHGLELFTLCVSSLVLKASTKAAIEKNPAMTDKYLADYAKDQAGINLAGKAEFPDEAAYAAKHFTEETSDLSDAFDVKDAEEKYALPQGKLNVSKPVKAKQDALSARFA